MFIKQTQSEDSGAIREILPEDLDRISGGHPKDISPKINNAVRREDYEWHTSLLEPAPEERDRGHVYQY
jgi:hypothetical protein